MDKWGKQFHDFVYDKTGWQMPRADGYFSGQGYSPSVPLDRPVGGRSQSELTVTFENAPPGMRVIDPKSGDPFMSVKTDVAYSPFRNPR